MLAYISCREVQPHPISSTAAAAPDKGVLGVHGLEPCVRCREPWNLTSLASNPWVRGRKSGVPSFLASTVDGLERTMRLARGLRCDCPEDVGRLLGRKDGIQGRMWGAETGPLAKEVAPNSATLSAGFILTTRDFWTPAGPSAHELSRGEVGRRIDPGRSAFRPAWSTCVLKNSTSRASLSQDLLVSTASWTAAKLSLPRISDARA